MWNLDVLIGIQWLGLPLEEILFAGTFGGMWAGIYHHFEWQKRVPAVG